MSGGLCLLEIVDGLTAGIDPVQNDGGLSSPVGRSVPTKNGSRARRVVWHVCFNQVLEKLDEFPQFPGRRMPTARGGRRRMASAVATGGRARPRHSGGALQRSRPPRGRRSVGALPWCESQPRGLLCRRQSGTFYPAAERSFQRSRSCQAFPGNVEWGCYVQKVLAPRPGPSRAGQLRILRAGLIGLVTGTVFGTVLIFWGLAFGEHPHGVGLALVVAPVFLVLSAVLDWWVYRTGKLQTSRQNVDRQPPAHNRSSH